MNIRMKTAYLILCGLWAMEMQSALSHGVKLAALRFKIAYLAEIIAKEHKHKDSVHHVKLSIIGPQAKNAPEEIRKNGCWGLAYLDKAGEHAHIFINSKLKNECEIKQTQAIFHELAHAYDPYYHLVCDLYNKISVCDPFPDKDMFTYYPYLRNDARAYIAHLKARGSLNAGLQLLSYEWYAEWQSIQWMAKYTPQQAEDLRAFYATLIDHKLERLDSPEYPPVTVMLKWLNEPSIVAGRT